MNRDEGRMNEGDPTMLVGGVVDVKLVYVCIEEEEEEKRAKDKLIRYCKQRALTLLLLMVSLSLSLSFSLLPFPSLMPPVTLSALEWCSHGLQERHGQ